MKQLELCGVWKSRHAGGYRGSEGDWPHEQTWMPQIDVVVPGTVQEALESMTGDVHLGHNVLNARWIEEETWLLSRTFWLEEADCSGENRVRLVMDRVMLYATVYLNGELVGEHQNFYTPYRPDVTAYVHPGENRIDVKLECGLLANAFQPAGDGMGLPREQAMRRAYCRSPQSSYEWDWSPRLLNVGLCGAAHLEIGPCFANECSVFHTLNEDFSAAELRIRQFLSVPTERTVRIEATVAETGDAASWEASVCGEEYAPLTLTVQDPKLWYPRGHGEPYRYTLRLTVTDVATGACIHQSEKKVGLRHVRVDQSPLAEGGQQFRLYLNGQAVFAKGANMVPLDILFSRFDRAAYETVISRAVEANFNFLRVWGGGIYETDDFYDLCDRNGLMVWQDFIGACANYPAHNRDFLRNYEEEIAYQVRRMSVYASAVLYCGNNEIDWGAQYEENRYRYTCASLYYSIVPQILHREGDTHYYQPSSPYSPDGSDANSNLIGDQHPWQIGFANRDYFLYREMDCRFPNEGGILGPTSLPNLRAALSEGQQFLHSFDFKLHDNSIADHDNCAPESLLEEKLGMKIGLSGLSLPDYVYFGGFLQGEGLTEYILNFRHRMSTTTGSAIFWMYEDCWPAARSWTIVDYLRNRTPSFFPVKRAFAPIVLDITENRAGGFDVWGVNESLVEQAGILRFAAVLPSAEGDSVEWNEREICIPANSATVLAHLDAPTGAIPCAQLTAPDGTLLARRRWVGKPYHELGLCKPEITVTVENGTAVYCSNTLVLGVCLDLDGDDETLSDNFFDLYPGIPYAVRLGGKNGTVQYTLNSRLLERNVSGIEN